MGVTVAGFPYPGFVATLLLLMAPRIGSSSQKLILILLDGFRWDYFQEDLNLKGFQKMFDEGTKAEYMQSVFPAVSYTNYQSIATGLWAESHGIIHNYMYDPDLNRTFWIGEQEGDFDYVWFKASEPIWVTAEKQKKKSYMLYWPGCSVNYAGIQPSYFEEYAPDMTIANFSRAINLTLEAMQNDSIDFAGIYMGQTDHYGHVYGPGSPELNQVIHEIDNELYRLLTYMQTNDMTGGKGKIADFVNVIIVSDHGMQSFLGDNHTDDHTVHVDKTVQEKDVLRFIAPHFSKTFQLWTKPDETNQVYKDLIAVPHMNVYTKAALPDHWHIKNNRRVPPLWLVAEDHWNFKDPDWQPSYTSHGIHGGDPAVQDMHAIFVAWGPNITQNHRHSSFVNIELYQLMCAILGIQSAPHNGTWENISGVLRDNAPVGLSFTSIFLMVLVVTSVFSLVFIGVYKVCCRKTVTYRKLRTDDSLENTDQWPLT